jgi:MYXO-CTERM domain-containing protein
MIHPSLPRLTLVLVVASLWACGPQELELLPDPVSAERPVVNGKTYNGHPSVGHLIIKSSKGASTCTATLVGKHTVLTAGHCVYPGYTHYFKLASGTYSSTKVVRHPQYSLGSQGAKYDIALIRLNSDPPITPSQVARKAPFVGQKITIIGYGVTSSYVKNSGVKRMAKNTVATVTSTRITFNGSSGETGNTCSGDSGGPAFAMVDGREVHLGVHSMASQPCGSRGINTRTDAFYSWLMTQSGGDLYEPPPDTQNPTVSIASPAAGAEVRQDFSVRVKATDDVGVTSIELFLDDKSQGKQSAKEATFELIGVTVGQRALVAEAKDAAGNTSRAKLLVTVVPPKAYGARCKEHLDCKSVLCAGDPYRNERFCTLECVQDKNCPQQAPCLPVAGAALHVCGLPLDEVDPEEEGSCSVASPAHGTLSWILLLGLALLFRRRVSR